MVSKRFSLDLQLIIMKIDQSPWYNEKKMIYLIVIRLLYTFGQTVWIVEKQ